MPSPQRSGVLAAGNWLVDRVKTIDAWPAQDALVFILSQTVGNGGGPYNVLKDLARLGATFPLAGLGLLGDDADGRTIREDCTAHGIDASRLHTTSLADTSFTDVMTVRDTGRRTFFHARGANALLAPAHFDFSGVTARWFYLGYLLLLDTLDAPDPACSDQAPLARDVLRRARAAGLLTALDCVSASPERFRTVVTPVLPEVDVLFVNDYEAEQLTGLDLGRGASLNRNSVEQAARALIALGVRRHVILHFPEGTCAASIDGTVVWQPAVRIPAPLIAGAAGAGDAFAAGCLLALHDDQPLAAALELGVCTAATSLLHPTCSESVRPAGDTLAFGRAHGFITLP
ncbi:carbohydrate kinase family protein [Rariglobus hedericola]|uniref:Carbohydrate kinase family protein n=1 Tax=Rariglobus hedericola TaxID=2597822 RepID=A0A556QSJ4_9BACT|nr:carbohydrate kinase family protein [Rariglobus hedericola]TSJ79615.1 carbohydrate kinase family protein [Rariglobus hedericola]